MTTLRSHDAPRAARLRRVWAPGLLAGAVFALFTGGWMGAQSPPSAPPPASNEGKAVYDERCARCHGATGKGDGVEAGLLLIRPRDFTTGRFKLRSTESGSLPTDQDLARTSHRACTEPPCPGGGRS